MAAHTCFSKVALEMRDKPTDFLLEGVSIISGTMVFRWVFFWGGGINIFFLCLDVIFYHCPFFFNLFLNSIENSLKIIS